MAKLMKLHLSGIRSFGPFEDQTQQLKFSSPVTLILGQNGCGKTTIIEALKYVCSGDLPGGTSSGQGFVNDPKMSGKMSTKGQIKLKILDSRGNEVTIARIMEVAQAAAGLKFKSVSSTIRRVGPDGTDRSVSGRCVDITSECCQIMNVSSAVLNNVIFCHQENSAWPLDEGKKLKEKFDEIFDAQKYNKCVEAFRKELKEIQTKIKFLKNDLIYKKEKKEFVEKQNRVLLNKQTQLQTYEDCIKTRNNEVEPLKKRFDEILELEKVLSDLQKELTTKEATKKGVIEEQNTIKRNLPFEFEGTNQELEDKIKSFSKEREKDEAFIGELERRKTDVENKSKMISNALQETQTQVGKLNQEKTQHLKKCTERNTLIEKSRVKLKLESLEGGDLLNHSTAKKALNQIQAAIDSSQKNLEKLIEEKEAEENNLQKQIDEARANTLQIKHNIDSKEKQMNECQQNIVKIDSELTNLASSDEFMRNCQSKIESIDKTINSLNNNFKETEESQKSEDYKTDIQNMERSLEKLESDYKILQQNDVIEGKLDSEKRLMMEKQREVNRIKTKHFDNLKKLFGESVPEKNLKDSILTLQTRADSNVKNLTEKITNKQKEVTTLEVRQRSHQDKITDCEKDLRNKKQKVSQACNGRNFTETLNASFQKKEKLQNDFGSYKAIRVIYNKYITEFEKDSPCCPICETDFKDRYQAVKKITTSLKNKLESVPQKLATVEAELQKEEAFYSKLQQLKLVNDEIVTFTEQTLPSLKQELEDIEINLASSKSELDELRNKLKEPQNIVDISRNIISDVTSLDQNQVDYEKSKQSAENLERYLVKVDSNKSKQEVEAEIDFFKTEINELRRKIDAQNKKIENHRDRIQKLTQERITLVEKRVKMREGAQSKPALEAQKEEFEKKRNDLSDEIFDLKGSLSLMEEELKNVITKKTNITASNKETIREERAKIQANGKILQDLETLQREIEDYLNNQIDEKLSKTEDKLKELNQKDQTLEQTKTKILDAISQKKEEIAKQELNFRTLKNNAILREKKSQEEELETQIQTLNRSIGGYNYRTVYEEKRQLCVQRENLESQINKLIGEKTVLQTTIDELREELERPENKKAYDNYVSKFYELKITEHVSKDVDNYVSALEKAVLDFHKSKMTQINKTIRELWRDTYRGNDIDYIEIKTDHATGNNARRRNYNYKVVQVKKGVELDMRGRCSAGQKVLACLIIRMALAETLSANCGILALDEPTTNLDKENIKSLSDTLSRIINSRQSERNFQLLVITHDEEFLTMLTRVQGVSYFYRVSRDEEGFSVIKKEYAM